MEKTRDYVMIYQEYYQAFAMLSDEQLVRLVKAMLEYAKTGNAQDFNGDKLLQIAWSFISVDIDRDMGR